MLAALAMPGAALAQATSEPTPADRQQEIIEQVHEEQTRGGVRSPGLIDPLTALGFFYQEQGDPASAAQAFQQARQIVRVNYGFQSFDEAPLLRQLVRAEEALGNVEAAWNLEQELISLIDRHPRDLRTVPILREIGDKRMDVLEQYRAGGFPPEIILGCYYGSPFRRSCSSGSSGHVRNKLLTEALGYYDRALRALLANGRFSSDEYHELEETILVNAYRHGDYFRIGRLLGRNVAYASLNPVSRLERIDALLRVADWSIHVTNGFRRLTADERDAVVRLYQRVYDLLVEEGVERAVVDEIFAPRVPVVLPAFMPNPLIAEKAVEPTGFIDVAFDVTEHGESENVEVLAATSNATRAAERDLVRLIERGSFRPRVTDGRIADASRVVVRYYLND